MVSNSQLPLFLWGKALKKDCYVHTKQAFLPVHISKGVLGTAFLALFTSALSRTGYLSINVFTHLERVQKSSPSSQS
jgi:hypothetical protein